MELTQAEYEALNARQEAYDAAMKERFPMFYRTGGCLTDDIQAALPPRLTNEEASALETYRFRNSPPERAFVYVKDADRTVTTWTGQLLGTVTDFGRPVRVGFHGARRRYIHVRAINGRHYHGWYCCDSGNYARLRLSK